MISGYFDDGSPICQSCERTCLTCSGPNPTDCNSCLSATFRTLRLDNSCLCDDGKIENYI